MAPLRTTSTRSIAESSAIVGFNSTSASIKQHTSATYLSESGKSRGTQARKKACEYCYRVHKRCEGTFPCDRCVKAGCAAECTEHKRQRHARGGDVPRSRAPTVTSSLRSSTGTANDQTHSSIPVELDIEPTTVTVAVARSSSALPSPISDAVIPVPCTTQLVDHYVPHVDTVSSPSLTDSSTTTDENTSPIDDALDACFTRLASEQWMSDTAVCAWDTLAQQHANPAALSQILGCGDPELWGFIETLISSATVVHDAQPATSSRPVSPGLFLT